MRASSDRNEGTRNRCEQALYAAYDVIPKFFLYLHATSTYVELANIPAYESIKPEFGVYAAQDGDSFSVKYFFRKSGTKDAYKN